MGAMITLIRPDGTPIRGYFANAGQDRPSVVVIQEWWGLNQQICSVADRFAQAGLNALAPDLYQGRVAQDPDEAGHLMNGLDFPGATHQDIRAATDYLKKVGSSVGVMGYCMGGALTIAAAVHVPGVAAAVCFYGIPPKEFTDPAQIRIPFQGHFANQDDWCTPQAVDTLEQSIVPLYYDIDNRTGIPTGWLRMVKESIRTIGPMFSATRMLKEYTTDLYAPAALNQPVED